MKNQFDLIIFDWDGTLVDSIDWIARCLKKAGGLCGLPIPEHQAAKDVIGLSIDQAMKKLYPEADGPTQSLLIKHYSREYFSRSVSRDDLFAGVYDMLHQLKAEGYQLAVATGKTRAGLDEALTGTGTWEFFCTTRSADETASKPDPKMLNEIIDHAQASRERTLMVGDSVHDLQMAMNARISSVALTCGAHPLESLQQFRPLLCLDQPIQLLEYM